MENKFTKKISEITSKPFTKETWWEVAAYAIRVASCVIPAAIILYQENSWQVATTKLSLGLLGGLAILAVFIVLYQPIKAGLKFIPGVLPFGIFVGLSILFKIMADSFLIIGISGLVGSVIAIPFHYKYLCSLSEQADEGLNTLKQIAEKLDSLSNKER